MNRETFSAKEALKLLGMEVRSCHEHEGLPVGSTGRIVQVRRGGKCKNGFSVAVQWQSSSRPSEDEFTKAEFERFLSISLGTCMTAVAAGTPANASASGSGGT